MHTAGKMHSRNRAVHSKTYAVTSVKGDCDEKCSSGACGHSEMFLYAFVCQQRPSVVSVAALMFMFFCSDPLIKNPFIE